jgi:hypothetical protein
MRLLGYSPIGKRCPVLRPPYQDCLHNTEPIHRRRETEASTLFLCPRYVLAHECRRRWLEFRAFRRAAGIATYGSEMPVLYGSNQIEYYGFEGRNSTESELVDEERCACEAIVDLDVGNYIDPLSALPSTIAGWPMRPAYHFDSALNKS